MKKSFSQTLNDIDRGAIADEMTEKLEAALQAVDGKPGEKATITLKIELKGRTNARIDVLCDAVLKLPKEKRESSIMFTTVEGNLVSRDPNQRDLEGMASVGKEDKGAAKRVDTSGGGQKPQVIDTGSNHIVRVG